MLAGGEQHLLVASVPTTWKENAEEVYVSLMTDLEGEIPPETLGRGKTDLGTS
jgi:hypothetical protein